MILKLLLHFFEKTLINQLKIMLLFNACIMTLVVNSITFKPFVLLSVFNLSKCFFTVVLLLYKY